MNLMTCLSNLSKLAAVGIGSQIVLTGNESEHRQDIGVVGVVSSIHHDHVGFKVIGGNGVEWFAEPQDWEIINL